MPKWKKISKSQLKLMFFGILVTAIIGTLIYFLSVGETLTQEAYKAKSIDSDISGSVFDDPQFKELRSPVTLPITSGPTGRDNPYTPY